MRLNPGLCAVVAVAAVAALALSMPSASATVTSPSTASTAKVGTEYFGDTDHCDDGEPYIGCHADLWKIPNLLISDRVTVAWAHVETDGPKLCITGNADDFDWADKECNISDDVYGSNQPMRTAFRAKHTAKPAFLTFFDPDCFGPCGYYGPYRFTVEKIQHLVLGALPARARIAHDGKLVMRPTLTNGAHVKKGTGFTLTVTIGGSTQTRKGTVGKQGAVRFNLRLPASAHGDKARFQVVKGASLKYLTFSSNAVRMTVK
jgi:hypothetical protein